MRNNRCSFPKKNFASRQELQKGKEEIIKKMKKSRSTRGGKKPQDLEENKNETKLRVFFKKKKRLGQSKEAARDNGRSG